MRTLPKFLNKENIHMGGDGACEWGRENQLSHFILKKKIELRVQHRKRRLI